MIESLSLIRNVLFCGGGRGDRGSLRERERVIEKGGVGAESSKELSMVIEKEESQGC